MSAEPASTFGTVELFGRSITLIPPGGLESVVLRIAADRCRIVYFCNVHMLMLASEDQPLAQAMDAADYVFADGVPVAWLQRRISGRENRVVRGYEAMLAICKHAASNERKIGLFGSTQAVLDALAMVLRKRFPNLNIALRLCPPTVKGELISAGMELDAINEAELDCLFVSLGCPKQEKWIHRYAPQLNCSLLGVGAAFDWLAGTTHKPPDWMENVGLAWLYRLMQNPKRMWHRYLIYNTKFIMHSAKLLTLHQRSSNQVGER
jgi:N-acetylglucosaminyldiphosphoundecaprenol N-acetyl-beta-D-mannosaminyltransferase